jgi:hypothetical protein
MGHLRSKIRTQDLKIGKSCKRSSGCRFYPNVLEICQESCFDDFPDRIENGLSPIKNKVTGAKNRKSLLTL